MRWLCNENLYPDRVLISCDASCQEDFTINCMYDGMLVSYGRVWLYDNKQSSHTVTSPGWLDHFTEIPTHMNAYIVTYLVKVLSEKPFTKAFIAKDEGSAEEQWLEWKGSQQFEMEQVGKIELVKDNKYDNVDGL